MQRHSETLVFIGAGATSLLGCPSTAQQTKLFRELCKNGDKSGADTRKVLADFFSGSDLDKMCDFLRLLDGNGQCIYEITDSDLDCARRLYGSRDEKILSARIHEMRSLYDWNAAKKILRVCPEKVFGRQDNLILDAYSIIDSKILSGQSLKVSDGGAEEIVSAERLQGARNFMVLFVCMLIDSAYKKVSDGECPDFGRYRKFLSSFARLMQKEGLEFKGRGYDVSSRNFYLFSTSFVCFNFDMFFAWTMMALHHDMNHHPPYIQDRPLRLWLDYGCEHRGRKILKNGEIVPTLEFSEISASRGNEEDHIGNPLDRTGKFYFAHGSSLWRECPVCGRMNFFYSNRKREWKMTPREIISMYPFPIFGSGESLDGLTGKEIEWRRKSLKYDSLQCMHCGSETKAVDAPMVMQTMYKSTPTSFLEEVQRNVRVSLSKARHIVLLGYSLPTDDTVWQQAFSEAVRSRKDTDEAPYCSVVVGYKGEKHWLYETELDEYIKQHIDSDDGSYGTNAINNARAVFGRKRVRAYTGGIPDVFGNCGEKDVKDLFYPEFVEWSGTRLE